MEGSLSLCRHVLEQGELTATDRLVGLVLALALIKGKAFTRMLLETLMGRTSLSRRTILASVKRLESAGVVERKRTGRAAIYSFPILSSRGKSREIVEVANAAPQKEQMLHLTELYTGPFQPGIGEKTEMEE